MFTSDEKKARRQVDSLLRQAMIYLAVSLFCALFGAVYEKFSHEVYSFFMIYAFAIPLALGAFPLLGTALLSKWELDRAEDLPPDRAEPQIFRLPGTFAVSAWNCGVAALTVGCIFRGVLEIYGTTNRLVYVYPAAAAVFLCAGLASFLLPAATAARMQKKQLPG